VTDHATSALLERARNTQTIRQSPQSADRIQIAPSGIDPKRIETASLTDKTTTTRLDLFSRDPSQENDVSSNFCAPAGQVLSDSRKIDSLSPSSTSTTKMILYSSGSVRETVRPRTPSPRELTMVAMNAHIPVRHRMPARTLHRAMCPPLSVTAWLWRVPRGLCNLDATMLAQPDIVPHRS